MEKSALTILNEKRLELLEKIKALSISIEVLQKSNGLQNIKFKDFKPFLITFMSEPRSRFEIMNLANEMNYCGNFTYIKTLLVRSGKKYTLK